MNESKYKGIKNVHYLTNNYLSRRFRQENNEVFEFQETKSFDNVNFHSKTKEIKTCNSTFKFET